MTEIGRFEVIAGQGVPPVDFRTGAELGEKGVDRLSDEEIEAQDYVGLRYARGARGLEERLRNCWAAPRGTAGQQHAELKRRARL